MEDKRRKIGIMGGTFDPIHIGHLILGETAYEQFGLDRILFMPSGNPPHKKNRPGRATDEQRVEMVRRAISFNPHFELSLIEMDDVGSTYTYRTLEELRAKNPDTDYYFIIGADSLFDFAGWMKPERICAACHLVVASRNHVPLDKLNTEMASLAERFHGDFHRLDSLNMNISSHDIRARVRERKSIRYYVTDEVREFIGENEIYRRMMEE